MVNPAPAAPAFAPLSPEWAESMDRQRALIAALIDAHWPGERLRGTRADFAWLQRIVDGRLIPPEDTGALQGLGVVFGDALADGIDGLAWCEVTDEYGTDPTLRFRETSLRLNALTALSKRIEQGEAVDVAALADFYAGHVRDLAPRLDDAGGRPGGRWRRWWPFGRS